MELMEMVLKTFAKYKDKYVMNGFIIKELMQSKEIKSIAKDFKKPRAEGGYAWSNQKTAQHLLQKYRFLVRGAVFQLRKKGYIEEILIQKNNESVMKNVMSDSKLKVQEKVAHRITKLGMKRLDIIFAEEKETKEIETKQKYYDPRY